MPQAIPAAAAAVAGAFATTGTVAYASIYAVSSIALHAAVAVGLGALAASQAPDVETQKQTRKQTRPLRVRAVGGYSRMSGPFMLRESKGNKLAMVIACCDDRLSPDGIQIFLNDDKVTLSGGYVQGMANERYGTGDLIRLEYRLGLPTETHYGFLTPDFGSYWPTTSRGDGIASIGLLAQHRSVESFARHFPNGIPEPSMVGAPVCYDWRDPTQDRLDESTWKVSWNPVVWLVHVEWTRHGRNWARCIQPRLTELAAEADYCDEIVDGEARYRVAGNYPVSLTPDAVRKNILATMDGFLSVNGKGQLIILAGRYVPPTFTITDDHIEGYSWKSFQQAEEAVNELVVSYVSAEHDFSEIEAGTYAKDEPNPLGRSESLALPWCPSPKQAMRLAPRKMVQLDAERRGQVRTGIYGLNGLGQRYIRVQNSELATMADVVCEVLNVEVDFANAQVIFDVIKADPDIDAIEVPTVDPVAPPRPTPQPGFNDPAAPPITGSNPFPISGDLNQINVSAHGAVDGWGEPVSLPSTTITGLSDATLYGVFWREDVGYEVEPYPATTRMASGSWLFLGWQTTPDASGDFAVPAAPPAGYAGQGPEPVDNSANIKRAGGGLFTGDLDAVGPVYVDNSVGTLENDLVSGSVIPAEAATFTGKGALAEKSQADSADIVANAVIAPMVVAPAGTVTTAGATSSGSYVEVFDFNVTTTGEPLIFMPSFMAKFWHPAGGDFSVTFRFLRIGFGQVRPDVVIDAINGDQYHGWQTPWFTDTPDAGTHTYEIRAWASTDSGFSHRDISDRQLIILRLPASTL